MGELKLTKEDLVDLLEHAAELGAARALKANRKALQSDWVPKSTALDMLCVSYQTLNRLVTNGYIRKSKTEGRKAVYFNRVDIESYKAGIRLIPKV